MTHEGRQARPTAADEEASSLAGRWSVMPQAADWHPMLIGGTALAGVTMHVLAETQGHWRSYWMKMEAGARSVLHRHSAIEMLVVVEGSVEDCDGAVFRSTEAVVYPVGSIHMLSSAQGCTLLVVESTESTLL